MAAILGAALHGIEAELVPPAAITGNAYDQDCPQLAPDWPSASQAFQACPIMAEVFPPLLRDCLLRCKRQEMELMDGIDQDAHWKTYLDTA